VARRHHCVDLALGSIIFGGGDSGAGLYGGERRRDDALDAGEEATRTLECHLVGRPVEESGEERLLGPDDVRDSRLDARFADQVIDVDWAALPEAVDPADSLLEHRGVPWKLDVDAGARGSLEIEANPSGIGREEHAAGRVVVEVHDVLRTPLLALRAGEERRSDAIAREQITRRPVREPEHPAPLAEHHHLASLGQYELSDQLAHLQELRTRQAPK